MAIKTLYRMRDGQLLVAVGHFNKEEIRVLMRSGYRFKNPLENKHGIRVEVAK